ncbi:uncharacterized protein K452DRAFT_306891 [Aplosporella prunicola CBS 121167]|uniref:Uncharacterized protein n=1 Tax=Aplosporella prunicola CBS 121167 TaxID=1176127 RepID=A0A6A6BKX1_9PEZI|nr:uncharacterized protein K452DRAFT_306891 [Aplosporella prunicola CBS 121167]KAF2144308.1 hypothetical protein K452DRAFT_306891 [Aplosporella prunicola CBS 121167]
MKISFVLALVALGASVAHAALPPRPRPVTEALPKPETVPDEENTEGSPWFVDWAKDTINKRAAKGPSHNEKHGKNGGYGGKRDASAGTGRGKGGNGLGKGGIKKKEKRDASGHGKNGNHNGGSVTLTL